MPIVEVNELTKAYPKPGEPRQRITVVDHIGFTIEEGEVFGILGPNGAGKTTTLEMIEGLTEIDSGEVKVCGIPVKSDPIGVKQHIGVQLQESQYFDFMTLSELLTLFGDLYHRRISATELLADVQLEEKANAFPRHLSGGQKQRFSIASALVNDPDIVFLDEPTTGLDPHARHNLWDLVRGIDASGKTVVLTTHYMDEAETLCDRVAIMDHGIIIALDTPQNLIAQYAPDPPEQPKHGTLEDVFLALTGRELRE